MYRVTQEVRLGDDNIIKFGSVVDGSQFDAQDTERLVSLGVLVADDDSFEQEHYNAGAVVYDDAQDQGGDDQQGQGDDAQDQQDQAEKPKSNRKNGG